MAMVAPVGTAWAIDHTSLLRESKGNGDGPQGGHVRHQLVAELNHKLCRLADPLVRVHRDGHISVQPMAHPPGAGTDDFDPRHMLRRVMDGIG